MGTISIYFHGICTFFEHFPPDSSIHRMVLVDAAIHSLTLGGAAPVTIVPHVARLRLPQTAAATGKAPPQVSPGVFDLNGSSAFTCSVVNADPSQGWANGMNCLPHLSSFIPPGTLLGPPSLPVIANGEAAAYVDFRYGAIEGLVVSDMGVARATIVTDGEPVLLLRWGGSTETASFTLPSGVAITFSNAPENSGDDAKDFLLNYLTVENPPQPISSPTLADLGCPDGTADPHLPPEFFTLDAGPGCSNTNYP
jgi:hypothetical protein